MGAQSGRCLDVTGVGTANGTDAQLWDCGSGANQRWTYTAGKELKVYGNKCLDAYGHGTGNGTRVVIWDCGGQANQQWNVNANGTITGVRVRPVPGRLGLWHRQRHEGPALDLRQPDRPTSDGRSVARSLTRSRKTKPRRYPASRSAGVISCSSSSSVRRLITAFIRAASAVEGMAPASRSGSPSS